jgi:hypothetical protein
MAWAVPSFFGSSWNPDVGVSYAESGAVGSTDGIPIAAVISDGLPSTFPSGYTNDRQYGGRTTEPLEFKNKFEMHLDASYEGAPADKYTNTYCWWACLTSDPINSMGKRAFGLKVSKSSFMKERSHRFAMHIYIELGDELIPEDSKNLINEIYEAHHDNYYVDSMYFIGKVDNPDRHILDILIFVNMKMDDDIFSMSEKDYTDARLIVANRIYKKFKKEINFVIGYFL